MSRRSSRQSSPSHCSHAGSRSGSSVRALRTSRSGTSLSARARNPRRSRLDSSAPVQVLGHERRSASSLPGSRRPGSGGIELPCPRTSGRHLASQLLEGWLRRGAGARQGQEQRRGAGGSASSDAARSPLRISSVLPMPASPVTRTTCGRPAATARAARSNAASSLALPTNTANIGRARGGDGHAVPPSCAEPIDAVRAGSAPGSSAASSLGRRSRPRPSTRGRALGRATSAQRWLDAVGQPAAGHQEAGVADHRWSGRTARPSTCQVRTIDSQDAGSVKLPWARKVSTVRDSWVAVAT